MRFLKYLALGICSLGSAVVHADAPVREFYVGASPYQMYVQEWAAASGKRAGAAPVIMITVESILDPHGPRNPTASPAGLPGSPNRVGRFTLSIGLAWVALASGPKRLRPGQTRSSMPSLHFWSERGRPF